MFETAIENKPVVLTDWTYQHIKEKILNLEIKPGSQIHIEDFIERLQVSRTPIREAFLKLAGEGLIEVQPRVGYFVVDMTEQDIRDLFEIREIIETRAAKKAAEILSDEELESMQSLISESRKAVDEENFEIYLKNEIQFHEFLQKHIRNKRLISIIEGLNDLTYRERVMSTHSIENINQSIIEHQRIMDGLLKRDGNLAEWYMGEHLHNVSERLVKHLNENKSKYKE